jgi:DNA-binding beta-propeller fold protein YncE
LFVDAASPISINKAAFVHMPPGMQVGQTLDVPKSPQEVLVRPDSQAAYVSCDASRQIAVIDLKQLNHFVVEKTIAAGKGADGPAWAESKEHPKNQSPGTVRVEVQSRSEEVKSVENHSSLTQRNPMKSLDASAGESSSR